MILIFERQNVSSQLVDTWLLGGIFLSWFLFLYEVLHVIRHFPLNFIVLRPRNSSSLLLPCFASRLGPLFQNLSPYVPPGDSEEVGLSPGVRWAVGPGFSLTGGPGKSVLVRLEPLPGSAPQQLSHSGQHLQTEPVLAKDLTHSHAERP